LLAGWLETGTPPDRTDQHAKRLATRLKRVTGHKLSKQLDCVGSKWYSRGWHIRRVEDTKHFNHLVDAYLPKHALENGVFKQWPIDTTKKPRM